MAVRDCPTTEAPQLSDNRARPFSVCSGPGATAGCPARCITPPSPTATLAQDRGRTGGSYLGIALALPCPRRRVIGPDAFGHRALGGAAAGLVVDHKLCAA